MNYGPKIDFHVAGAPTEPWNNPYGTEQPHGELPKDMGLQQQGVPLSDLSPENVLGQIRARYPFLPILPLPSATRTLFLATANAALDMYLPDSAAIMMLRGSTNYLISTTGNAAVPSATNNGQGENDPAANKSWFAPEGIPLFVYGIKSISLVSEYAGTYVTAAFWAAGLVC